MQVAQLRGGSGDAVVAHAAAIGRTGDLVLLVDLSAPALAPGDAEGAGRA